MVMMVVCHHLTLLLQVSIISMDTKSSSVSSMSLPSAHRGEPPPNFSVILLPLSSGHYWWPCWMACSLDLPEKLNSLLNHLTSHYISLLACQQSLSLLGLPLLSSRATQASAHYSNWATAFPRLLVTSLVRSLPHLLWSLATVLNSVSSESSPKSIHSCLFTLTF